MRRLLSITHCNYIYVRQISPFFKHLTVAKMKEENRSMCLYSPRVLPVATFKFFCSYAKKQQVSGKCIQRLQNLPYLSQSSNLYLLIGLELL